MTENVYACVMLEYLHLHLSSCLLRTDSFISRICAMSTRPPSPLLAGQLRQPRQIDLSVAFHTVIIKPVTA